MWNEFYVIQHTFEDKSELNDACTLWGKCEAKCTHVHYEANVHMDILLNVVVENLEMSFV